MKTILLLAFVGLALAEPEGAARDASSDSKRSQSNRQGHFVPAHDRPSTVVIKYSIPNHRDRTAHSQSQVSVTRTQHPGISGGPPRFRNAPSAEEDEEAKEAHKEETLIKSDSSVFTRTKKPVPMEMDDDFPKPEKKVRTKSKDDGSIATLKDFGKKPFDDIAFGTGGDDSVTSTKSTDTKSATDEKTETGKGPAFRVFPYLLIGRTTSGTEFPFLAMLRESQQNSNVASEKPFIPAFVAMNPEDPAAQSTATRQAAVPAIAPFPSPSLHPELLRAIPEPPKLTPSPEEFLRTAEHPSDERPRLVAAPIFNLPLPPMESLVRENIMSSHPSNFIRGREPEMPFNDMHLREMPRRPRFLPEFERQPMFERPPMFEREPMFVRPRFFPEPPLPMRHM